jgi:hypothetical protein
MFIQLLILSTGFLAIAVFGFSLNILFKENGRFPNSSISKNKELRKRKIFCIKTEQKMIDNQLKGIKTFDTSCELCDHP